MIIENLIIKKSINQQSHVPKYRQLANYIIQAIENGEIQIGEKLPSISELQAETGLARDTIVKSFTFLREKKIVTSVMSKGFYVARNVNQAKSKLLIIMNKLSSYKLKIYHSFVDALGGNYQVDLRVHHCNGAYLRDILEEQLHVYDYFVVMPHFSGSTEDNEAIIDYLRNMPSEKLLLMDKLLPDMPDAMPCIYQDFGRDIYSALKEGRQKLKEYDNITLVFPENPIYPYPEEIKHGFIEFCEQFGCQYEIIDKIYDHMEFRANDAYIIIDEEDLIRFLQQAKDLKLKLGRDIGVISYNDTSLKEVLGISVMTTDFEVMADSAAYMIKKKKTETVQNYFSFIDRGSI
ncbi:transcriptional regulator [Echinicola pacifica]|uniref:Transcriptional regulator n=1 Tax=Echinicola pacifica TaxID=346377 RepID=A0A918PW53_9BACT|nr:GntR family transcriptional regulator [Echinicola pacifica]GGZ25229.1 transcriptional regulator [Echinicola pacifica]